MEYFRLIYDKGFKNVVDEQLIPLVQDIISANEPFGDENNFSDGENLLLFLSTAQLKKLFTESAGKDLKIAVLPHPDANELCKALGVDPKIEKSIDFLKECEETVKMDMLFCKGHAVFHHVVIGHTFKLTSDVLSLNQNIFKRSVDSVLRYFKIKPFRVDVEMANDMSVKTVVAGIVVSEHRKSSLLSQLTLKDSSLNDGKMHAFFIMPRSLVQMLSYAFSFKAKKKSIPSFAGHVKTSSIKLTFPDGAREYLVDNIKHTSDTVTLNVEKDMINIYPGADFDYPDKSPDTNDIYKLSALPSGEAAQVLAKKKVPIIRNASTEEFKELFSILRENARLKSTFLSLMVLSTILATFGLFANSSPVVIGAMILAPLMSPIISLSMGALRQDKSLLSESLKTIIAGLGISLVFAVLITLLTPIQTAGSEILARTRPNLLDLGIAVVSGIAGAYAHAREEVAKTLAGVAIAVALIPPLAVTAIGIGWADSEIFVGAALLLATNLAGMVLAASLTFMFLGFSPLKLAGKGMLVSTILVLILCIPLALGFNEMVAEYNVIKHVESIKTENMHIRDVKVINHRPMKLSIKLVSDQYVSDDELDKVKMLIQEEIMHEVELEIVIAVRK